MPSRVTRETLRSMIDEFDLIPMSDRELDLVVPQLQSLVDAMGSAKGVDVADVRSSHVFHASLSGLPTAGGPDQLRLG